jgi:hypothetical protein
MSDLSLEDKWKLLNSWSQTLSMRVESTLPKIQKALDSSTELPNGCPSHVSLALMEFRYVEKAFDEVFALYKMVEKAIVESET